MEKAFAVEAQAVESALLALLVVAEKVAEQEKTEAEAPAVVTMSESEQKTPWPS